MINILLSLCIGIASFTVFATSYQINGINRTMINIPIEYFNTSIPMVTEIGEINPYFDKNYLEDKITDYFNKTITRYVDKYTVGFYYYNSFDDSVCLGDECQGVDISLHATIINSFNYDRTMFYEIRSKND